MRVIVQYDPYNRLGNRMFQYAFGVLLAKKYNCELYCNEGLPNFDIPPNPCNISNKTFNARSISDQYFDFSVLADFDGDIIIDSWVQKSEYYINHRDLLRNVFGIKYLQTINKNDLILHVRATDYTQLDWFLGYDFYKNLIKDSQFSKVKIVTDDPTCETISKLLQDGCELVSSGTASTFNVSGDRRAIDDFKTLLYSENIALSQSSFSWWAAFLGVHKNIIFPYTTKNVKQPWPINPGRDDVDLYFDFNGKSSKYVI